MRSSELASIKDCRCEFGMMDWLASNGGVCCELLSTYCSTSFSVLFSKLGVSSGQNMHCEDGGHLAHVDHCCGEMPKLMSFSRKSFDNVE